MTDACRHMYPTRSSLLDVGSILGDSTTGRASRRGRRGTSTRPQRSTAVRSCAGSWDLLLRVSGRGCRNIGGELGGAVAGGDERGLALHALGQGPQKPMAQRCHVGVVRGGHLPGVGAGGGCPLSTNVRHAFARCLRQRSVSAPFARRLRGASVLRGGRDWLWLSCRWSSNAWTWFVPSAGLCAAMARWACGAALGIERCV